jgi:hypothetical protein
MADQEIKPTHADAKVRSLGKWLTGSGLMLAVMLGVVGLLAFVIAQQAQTIDALASSLTQQRSQFEACKAKPVSTAGCTTPVAAEPSVIIKAGSRGPIGDMGPQGPVGPQGPQGPQGVPGPIGKTGPPPGCTLLATGCIGAQGATGAQGAQGPKGDDGADGKQGPKGDTGDQGPQGMPGKDAPPPYSVVDQDCVGDGDQSMWRVYLSNGTDQRSFDTAGPCRVGPAPLIK